MLRVVITFVSLLLAFQASAITLTLSEKHVNQMVKMTFPQTQYYNQIKLTFTDPVVTLGSLEDDVAVQVNIMAQQNGQTLNATGKMKGLLKYRAERKELQIEKPTLVEFKVQDNTLENSQALMNAINQMQGRQFPMILLLDFTELNLGLFGNQLPKRIDIVNKHLVIEM
ncbi:DUF1439 domain-containing protein [Alteromonas antoniana]|uniref:DUF1439 domain-containing protein n=1 Tax=Alteromonas antoniana TaxID=2803813 RepID=UPI001C443EC2|nr:DUF1439 domain-containing protein [Alteromonas antoniana]